MTNTSEPRPFSRAINGMLGVAFCAFFLASYWPVVKVLDLSRADLQFHGIWIGDHAKQITAVTPGGVAERAGLRAGDVMEFNSARDADWVLASYRNMPEGFTATMPVRHIDGSRSLVTLAPERVGYLPTLNDRLALVVRLVSLTILMLICLAMVWVRPSVMTWSLLLNSAASAPTNYWFAYFLAFKAGPDSGLLAYAPLLNGPLVVAMVPFALCFPRDSMTDWFRWQRVLFAAGIGVAMAFILYRLTAYRFEPFESWDRLRANVLIWFLFAIASAVVGIAALGRTYRRADGLARARLRWALLGVSAVLVGYCSVAVISALPYSLSQPLSGRSLTPGSWVMSLCAGFLLPLTLGVAVFRQRVIDIQFAVSRTLVYGAVTTLALVFLAAVHWLLGRMIEQSGLAFGLEGIAAIGLGLVLHRTSHGINLLVDRVLFRRHHRAEERLRRVTAALPFATDERSIAEALVTEPVRNLDLASAALFYRDSAEGPLRRVLAHGWSEEHATSLDAEALLVRYLQAEHEPLRLDDPHLLPSGIPEEAALPVLAIPIVNQHVLAAVVLYGAHANHSLLDPDEVELLHALAKAAATSHQQVRIATLARDVETQRIKNEQLEASFRMLAQGRVGTTPGEGRQ